MSAYSTLNRWDFFSTSSELFFEDVRPPFIIQDEYNFKVEAGFPLGVHNKLSFGSAYFNARDEYYQTKVFNKEDEPDKTDFNGFVFYSGIESNSFNYKQYATEGKYRCLSFKYVTGKEIITRVLLHKILAKAPTTMIFIYSGEFTTGTLK